MRTILTVLFLAILSAPAGAAEAYVANNGELLHFDWSAGDGVFTRVPAVLIDMQGRRVACGWDNAGDGEAVITCGKRHEQVIFDDSGFRYDGVDFRALK